MKQLELTLDNNKNYPFSFYIKDWKDEYKHRLVYVKNSYGYEFIGKLEDRWRYNIDVILQNSYHYYYHRGLKTVELTDKIYLINEQEKRLLMI